MDVVSYLERNYSKALELGKKDFEFKLNELHQLCNELKLEGKEIKSNLKELINEIFKIGTIISTIKWSDKSQDKKEKLLEQCRLMIEVYLGQALILEMECEKLSGH